MGDRFIEMDGPAAVELGGGVRTEGRPGTVPPVYTCDELGKRGGGPDPVLERGTLDNGSSYVCGLGAPNVNLFWSWNKGKRNSLVMVKMVFHLTQYKQ